MFDPAAILPFRTDAHLAQHNAVRGLEAVLQHEDRITQELPSANLAELREIQPLTHAVLFAAKLVNRTPEATLLRDLIPEAYDLRRRLLTVAVALSESKLLPEREVEAIRQGKGQVDAMTDLTQLPALFRRHQAAIEGKHPLGEADLERAEALGKQLLQILRPGAAPASKVVSAALQASVDARDSLWTLLTRRHEQLWRVGAWLFGHEVDNRVPALQSRRVSRKTAKTPSQPVTS
ncbi:MAG: hypothetical protein MUF54_20435 [Polyangiaceae bacterium]|nr:hypothetical protein [Polyangiaceae bacterium]